jgi:hypothetical protein
VIDERHHDEDDCDDGQESREVRSAAILKTLKISPPSRILAVDRPAQTRRRT